MAAELTLLVDIAVVLGSASVGGYLASRLRQPVLLGYLLSGILIGPTGLGLVSSGSEIQILAEIGVALLLFVLGIEFSLQDLIKVRGIALGGGTLQILLTLLLGGGLALITGLVDTLPKAIFLGAVLSLSSTAVVLKTLIERNEVQTDYGQGMLAILIVQDLSLGLMLAVLPVLAQPLNGIGLPLAIALLKAALFIAGAMVAGIWILPVMMRRIALTGSQELFVLCVFALCLGVALLTAWLGLGIAMGAFVAGLMISEVESADQALDRVLPMRDIFATLFFASIGTLIDPGFLLANAPILIGLVSVVMVGKALIVAPIVMLFGYSLKTAVTVALGINQIGEFSFVLAKVAQEQKLFSDHLFGLTVGTTAITLLITPFMLKAAGPLMSKLEELPLIGSLVRSNAAPRAIAIETGMSDHIVVAGYGRVGQTLVRLLRSQGHQILVIDSNEAMVQQIRALEISYLYGDAASELVLQKADLLHAKAMAITLPDPLATRLVLKRALSIAPELDVTVRAHDNREIDALYQLGSREVVQPEFEAALEIGAHLLLSLGTSGARVQQLVNEYRNNRYRTLLPERSVYQVANTLAAEIEGLEGHWYTVTPTSPLVGLTLAAANVRRLTGASVMEIQRGDQVYPYPGPETILAGADRLLVVGNTQERAAFEALLSVPDGFSGEEK